MCDTGRMKQSRLVITALLVAASHALLRADVTITMTNSIEGPMAALAGGNPAGITMRVQGLKARTDTDVMGRTVAMISDVVGQQMLMLDQTERTVRRMPLASLGQPNAVAGGGLNVTMPKMDVTVERTGQTAQVAGQSCEEFHIVMIMDMSQVGGTLPTPEAREATKDMRLVMKGSSWVSTSSAGASDFIKFQEAARAAGMTLATNLFGGLNPPDPLAQAGGQAEGLPCLSEIEMSYEGTGPMIEMLKKTGTIKVTSRLTEISLDPIPAAMFVVPADYKETSLQAPLIPRP
jgi:hypothetical protein